MNLKHSLKKGIKGPGWRPMLVAVLILALVGSIGLPLTTGGAIAEAAVYLSPPSQTVAAGETTTVDIMVKDVSNLYGAEVHISFDEALLEVQDADAEMAGVQIAPSSDLFPFQPTGYYLDPDTSEKLYYYSYSAAEGGYFIAQCEADNTLGVIDYTITLLDPDPDLGSAAPVSVGLEGAVLATITFTCPGEGTSDIAFENVAQPLEPAVKLADANGDPIAVASTSGATIVQDATPPTVTATSPTADAPDVALDADISVTFSEAMDTASAESAFSTSVSGSFIWVSNTLTLVPDSDFSYDTTYSVTIDATAEDLAGNAMVAPHTWGFTTTSPPFATRTLPDAVSQGETFDVTITFTAPVDNFHSIGIYDFAPTGWSVAVDKTWCTPTAATAVAADNKVEYSLGLLDSYTAGTGFTIVYQVTVPTDAALENHTFEGGYIEYYVSGALQPTEAIGGKTKVTVVAPVLSLNPDPLSHDFGDVPVDTIESWSFEITNAGVGTLNWTVDDDQTWLTVSPTSGDTTTETDTVTVQIDTSTLATCNTYQGTITVNSNSGIEPTRVGDISVNVVVEVLRSLPDTAAIGGSPFEVTLTFTAPVDNFHSIGVYDFAPTGWSVSVDKTWCTPTADTAVAADNKVEYSLGLLDSYTAGTGFTVVYKVSVPHTVTEGIYEFTGGYIEYYVSGEGPYTADIIGEFEIQAIAGTPIVGLTHEANSSVLGEVTITLYKGGVAERSTLSDANGNYEIVATEPGDYEVVASKAGFKDETSTVSISVEDFGQEVTLNFEGKLGLMPKALELSYLLSCSALYLFPPSEHPEWGIELSDLLSASSSYLFPVTE